MSSIAEALVATAVGLAVAIPAVAAYNFYQRHTRSVLGNTDALTNVLLAHLSGEESPARPPPPKANPPVTRTPEPWLVAAVTTTTA